MHSTEKTLNFYYSCMQLKPAHNNHTIVLWMTYFRLTASASMLVSVSRILHVARLLFCTATCRAEKKQSTTCYTLGLTLEPCMCIDSRFLQYVEYKWKSRDLQNLLTNWLRISKCEMYLAFNIPCAIIIC